VAGDNRNETENSSECTGGASASLMSLLMPLASVRRGCCDRPDIDSTPTTAELPGKFADQANSAAR
jgi:hypothetical protein